MKLCQFHQPGRGRRVGLVEGDEVVDITVPAAGVRSVLDLVVQGKSPAGVEHLAMRLGRGRRPRLAWATLDRPPAPRRPHLLAPIDPPEVWGAGITYWRSRDYYTAHSGEGGRRESIYDHVYASPRPELFFKATAARTVGPNGAVGIRHDSRLTAVEAELAVVVGVGGRIVAYTIGNDLSAWDLERENPLFLPQSKIFAGCFALGPVLVTPREVGDPHALELRCAIRRGGAVRWEGRVSTREMRRRSPELVEWLARCNPVPPGTVLTTGTGILVPDAHALAEGDRVEIELERVGTLRNRVRTIR